MLWLRVLAGLVFLAWVALFGYTVYTALRPWRPGEWKSDKGQLDTDSEEFRRLIMK